MDEARTGPGGGSGAMGDGADPTRIEASAEPGLRDRARETVRDARETAMTEVRDRTDRAKQSATRMADERKRSLADSVHALASAFDAAANSLSEGQQGRLAEWTRELSGRAHRMASYLDEQDTRALVTDLEDSARRHPTAFLGTTFAAGVAAGRFLRATQRTDTGATGEASVDFDFHADAALLADDRPEAGSYGGSAVGETSSGGFGNPGSGFGTTGVGHVGTGGAGLASRAAGSAPIGAGTGGLAGGGSIGDDLSSTDPNAARRDGTAEPQRATGREGGL